MTDNQPINNIEDANIGYEDMTSYSGKDHPNHITEAIINDDTGTNTTRPSHYETLDINDLTSREYQNLEDVRPACVDATSVHPESSNLYEPLRKKAENQYERLDCL